MLSRHSGVLLLGDRDAALAVEHPSVADDKAGPGGRQREPIDLAGVGHAERSRTDDLQPGETVLEVGGENFAFDTDDNAAGLRIDADGAAREPARVVKARLAVRRNDAEHIRPLRLAPTISALSTDISAGPVGA